MEATASGKGERLPADGATVYDNFCPRFFQVLRIHDDHWASCSGLGGFEKTTTHAAIVKADVVGILLFEVPAEDFGIEAFSGGEVDGRKFDIIHAKVLVSLVHGIGRLGIGPVRVSGS